MIRNHTYILAGAFAAALLLGTDHSEARLGETAAQNAERYGPHKTDSLTKALEKGAPLLEGAIIHTYEYQGWKIRAAFLELDGPAVRIEYKKASGALKDYEVDAILKAEGNWGQVPYDEPLAYTPQAKAGAAMMAQTMGNKMWERSDGAIARLIFNSSIRIELPAARQHEEALKQAKELKARMSVPKF